MPTRTDAFDEPAPKRDFRNRFRAILSLAQLTDNPPPIAGNRFQNQPRAKIPETDAMTPALAGSSDDAAMRTIRSGNIGHLQPPHTFPDFGNMPQSFRNKDQLPGADVSGS